jgi:SAM-dependent methyltransferase
LKTDIYAALADFYDTFNQARGYVQDIPFYVDLADQAGGTVCEMGCGTGRVLLPVARRGLPIQGVDNSPAMLDQLKEALKREKPAVRQRVKVTLGDIRTTRLPARFSLITAPFRVVQHLLRRSQQRQWLRNVARHLTPEGILVFDVFQPDFEMMMRGPEPALEADYMDQQLGCRFRMSSSITPNPPLQTLRIKMSWEVKSLANGAVAQTRSSFTVRWFTRAELLNLLELEGFEVLDYWGDFDRSPFGKCSPQQIIRARLARRQ